MPNRSSSRRLPSAQSRPVIADRRGHAWFPARARIERFRAVVDAAFRELLRKHGRIRGSAR